MICLEKLLRNAMHAANCELSHAGQQKSGLRAEVLDDLIFVDHGEIKFNPSNEESSQEISYTFFITLDGATNLIAAYPVASTNENEVREALR